MHSRVPKVLQNVLGEPMLRYVLDASPLISAATSGLVTGHKAEMVEEAVPGCRFILQKEQLGTGHALGRPFPNWPGPVWTASSSSTVTPRL